MRYVSVKPPVYVRDDAHLQRLFARMKEAAEARLPDDVKTGALSVAPSYSSSIEEANRRAMMQRDAIMGDPQVQVFRLHKTTVSTVLGLEGSLDQPLWHLSLGGVNPTKPYPIRVQDQVADKFLQACFGVTTDIEEGPSEGAFVYVRHFRRPYP